MDKALVDALKEDRKTRVDAAAFAMFAWSNACGYPDWDLDRLRAEWERM